MIRVLLAIIVLVIASLACGTYVPTVTPTAAPSATPTPTATPVPTATVTPFPAAEDGQTAVVRAALVNVRSSPDGEVVGQVEAGQSVTVLGYSDDGEWAQIEAAEIGGWIFSGCLQGSEKGCVAK
jgi:uncharacterized protein YgiM (DUF1202 family)